MKRKLNRFAPLTEAAYVELVRLHELARAAEQAFLGRLGDYLPMRHSDALSRRLHQIPIALDNLAVDSLPPSLTHTAHIPARELADAAIECVLSAPVEPK